MTKKIDNETYEDYLNNKDYIAVAHDACRPFRDFLSKDELKSCRYMGLWNAMRHFNGKSKFTTYLYNRVRWECLYRLKQEKKPNTLSLGDLEPETEDNEQIDFDDTISNLTPVQQEVLDKYFRQNKTFKEIGKEMDRTHETARTHFKRAIDSLKAIFGV